MTDAQAREQIREAIAFYDARRGQMDRAPGSSPIFIIIGCVVVITSTACALAVIALSACGYIRIS